MSALRVAVFSPNRAAVSETFIRAHIERLPQETVPVYGGGWGRCSDRGPLWPRLRFPGAALSRLAPTAGRMLYEHALAGTLGRLGVHVALAEYGTTGTEIRRACLRAKVPLVVYFFGFEVWRTSLVAKLLPEYRRLFADAAALIAVSGSIRNRLAEWGAPTHKLHHLVCGADAEQFDRAAPESAEPMFVAVGRFVEKKAPHLTLRAFREVVRVEPRASLIMVGDGPMLGACRALAAELGLKDAVTFAGPLPLSEVARLYTRARAFVQHSITAPDGDREGTPVAILEAQMAGLPVVATRHSGIPEIVLDGDTGLLVDEGDSAAMGVAMARFAGDASFAGQCGRRARTHARTNFSQQSGLRSLGEILERAARERDT